VDGEDLILIRRCRPGQDPYWVTVGGGVEPDDASVEDALHREVFEELGGKIRDAARVFIVTDALDDGAVGVQHFFVARLASMDVAARTGTEFTKPERGSYDIIRVPFTAEALAELRLMPPVLGEFVAANVDGLRDVLDPFGA